MSLFERFVTEGNERGMSWQNLERCLLEETWRRSEPAQFSWKETRSTRRCSMQVSFAVCGGLVRLGRTWTEADRKVDTPTHERRSWCFCVSHLKSVFALGTPMNTKTKTLFFLHITQISWFDEWIWINFLMMWSVICQCNEL